VPGGPTRSGCSRLPAHSSARWPSRCWRRPCCPASARSGSPPGAAHSPCRCCSRAGWPPARRCAGRHRPRSGPWPTWPG
jgi:hypothetical protein